MTNNIVTDNSRCSQLWCFQKLPEAYFLTAHDGAS